jgi:riboflavin kinase/FMN adenylyltransferase
MRLYQSLGDLPLGGPRRVIAIGAFDGVHRGHQAIVGRAMEIALARGLPAMVVTFTPNPIMVLRPDLKTTVLTGPALKAALIARLGADELLCLPFTRSFARIRADRFAEMLLSAPIGADVIVVGRDFRYGSGAEGTVETLTAFGRGRGLTVEVPDIVASEDGKPISSTRIRRLIAQGEVAEVVPLLGRPHCVEGVVARGDGRGRGMGFPTMNIEVPDEMAMPRRGVYAGRVVLADGARDAAINVGHAPTFATGADPPLRLEAHLLDYLGGDLYGQPARVEFLERLRDERRFASVDELVSQLGRDVGRVREILGAGP